MEEKLREHIEEIFSTVPCTEKAVEMREEILQNLLDRYHDLLAEGKSEEAAYSISVEGIGDVNELLGSLNLPNMQPQQPVQDVAENERSAAAKHKNAILTAVAVMLYILSPVPCIIFEDAIIGPVLLFVIVAAATGIIIYKTMTKETYAANHTAPNGISDEQYQQADSKRAIKKCLSAVLWLIVVIAYFAVSFSTGAWYITWLTFLIGAALDSVLRTAVDLTK